MMRLDETHDPKRQSWVTSANGHPDFPIQNLPVGVFSLPGGTGAVRHVGAASIRTTEGRRLACADIRSQPSSRL